MRPTAAPGTLAIIASVLASGVVRAGEVRGLRSDQVFERRQRTELTMDRGHATMVVRRTVENLGSRHDQVTFDIGVPNSAVAVALRTLGVSNGQPIWFRGDLLEAEEAARRYQELTGIGGFYPKDPALLSWRSQGRLALQVFPVAPRGKKTIEYTLEVPTEYAHGRDIVRLPREMAGELIVRSAVAGGQVLIDGVAVQPDRVVSPSSREGPWIEQALPGELYSRDVSEPSSSEIVLLSRAPVGKMEGRLAAIPFGASRVLNHFRFDAPPRFSVAPRGAWIVAIVDGSRSFAAEDRRAGLAALAAALSHHGEGRVAVLVFDRKVHRLFPGFRDVANATRDLVDLDFVSRNGSQVDAALTQADHVLDEESPSTAPRRILVITDLRTRMALRPSDSRLRSGAVVHVGVVGGGEPRLDPNDESAWSEIIERTGGVVWKASATAAPVAAGEMTRVYEEWARPMRLRHVKIFGADDGPFVDSDALQEGEAIERLAIDRHMIHWAKLEGKLWGKRVEHRLLPAASEARLWAALVFGSGLLYDLTEPEMMVLARRGRAVSPVTSYLAIEPGVRPSTEGLERRTARAPDVIAGVATVRGQPEPPRLDRQKFLEDELGRAWRECGRERRESTVVLETTLAEVVDVPAISVTGTDAALSRCLEEAVWNLDLPPEFEQPWARWTVSLPPRVPTAKPGSAGRSPRAGG